MYVYVVSCPTRTKNLERYITTLLLPTRDPKLVKVRTVEWMRPDGSKRGQQKCVATYADYALYPYAAGCCSQLGQIAKTRHELDWKKNREIDWSYLSFQQFRYKVSMTGNGNYVKP